MPTCEKVRYVIERKVLEGLYLKTIRMWRKEWQWGSVSICRICGVSMADCAACVCLLWDGAGSTRQQHRLPYREAATNRRGKGHSSDCGGRQLLPVLLIYEKKLWTDENLCGNCNYEKCKSFKWMPLSDVISFCHLIDFISKWLINYLLSMIQLLDKINNILSNAFSFKINTPLCGKV